MSWFRVVNPRAGDDRPSTGELVRAAAARGIRAHVLGPGEDPAKVARAAAADAIGVAGGDGSLAAVAAVALERDVPFVCVPLGTRNHFALDVGLDRDDPIGALAAFSGRERRVDIGRAGGRLFLNNVSFGLYASLVAEAKGRRGRLGAALRLAFRGEHVRLEIDGRPVTARIVVVGNNVYRLHPFELGERPRLDEGVLQLGIAHGLLPQRWEERRGLRFEVAGDGPLLEAAIDGEPVRLEAPLRLTVEPLALRVLVPDGR